MGWDKVLFVGDTHCGGHRSIWPTSRLPEVPRFPWVRYLSECWNHLLQVLPKRIPLTILMGDLIEGNNRKAQGIGLFSARLSDQVEGAIEVLQEITKRSDMVLRVSGTDYHDSEQNPLLALDYALGVSKQRQVFDLDMGGGRILNVAHHPSGGGALYQGTKLDKEGRLMELAAISSKVPYARWIVRAHLHNFRYFGTPNHKVVLLPCWKLPDAYSIKGNYFGWQPDIGVVLMEKDPLSSDGFAFREILYQTPEARVYTKEDFLGDEEEEYAGETRAADVAGN